MKVSRKIFVALIGSIALAIGVVTPAHATTTIKYVNCSGMPAHVASMGYQNSPGDLLYVKAAGAAQLKIHTYTLTVTAPGVVQRCSWNKPGSKCPSRFWVRKMVSHW